MVVLLFLWHLNKVTIITIIIIIIIMIWEYCENLRFPQQIYCTQFKMIFETTVIFLFHWKTNIWLAQLSNIT